MTSTNTEVIHEVDLAEPQAVPQCGAVLAHANPLDLSAVMVTPSTRLMLIEPRLLRVYDGESTRHYEPEEGLVTAEGVIEVMQEEFQSDWFNERHRAGRRFPLVVPLEE